MLEPLQTAGPLCSTDITPLPRYYRPSRIPLAFHRLPGVTGYTASLLRRFLDGARRASPVAQHDLVTVLSLPTPPKCCAASVLASLHAAFARKVRARAFGLQYFRGHMGSLALRPADSLTTLEDGFVNRLQRGQFVGIEIGRANFRWEVTSLALSIARWVHSSTMAAFPAPPIIPDGQISRVRFETLACPL